MMPAAEPAWTARSPGGDAMLRSGASTASLASFRTAGESPGVTITYKIYGRGRGGLVMTDESSGY
jgi:hypothetical protein